MIISSLLLLALVVAIVLVGQYLLSPKQKIHRDGKPILKPPNTLSLLGNTLDFVAPRHDLLEFFTNLHNNPNYGFNTYEISVPTLPPGVVVNDPKVLEFILRTEGPLGFVKGEFFRQRSWDLFGGHGIINTSGQPWKVQRKIGIKFFSQKRLQHIVDDVFPKYWVDVRQALLKAAENDEAVDIQELFLEFTTRVMGKVAFGMDLHVSHPFSAAFDYASNATGLRFQNPLYKLTEIFTGAKFRSCVKAVKTFGRDIVQEAVQRQQKRGHVAKRQEYESEDEEDMVDAGEEDGGELVEMLLDTVPDQQAVADAAVNFLSAGRDTTSESLTWTLHLLLRNPHYINQFMSTHPNPALFSTLNPSDTPLIHSVVLESLRLYPPVPFELKQVQNPAGLTLPDGVYLPQHAITFWSPWSFGRSKALWGEDADVFRPERWLDDDNGGVKIRAWSEYPVFNGGARLCIGRRMGELIDIWVLGELLREFEVEEVDKVSKRRSRNSLTLPMDGGLIIKVKQRSMVKA